MTICVNWPHSQVVFISTNNNKATGCRDEEVTGCFCRLMLWQSAGALVLEGYDIPESVPVTEKNATLTLQGAAVRSWYFVVKGYIGALYIENPSTSVTEIRFSKSGDG